MTVGLHTPIQSLIEKCPSTEEILDWYGVDTEEIEELDLDVADVCFRFQLDREDFLTDLRAAVGDAVREGKLRPKAEDEMWEEE